MIARVIGTQRSMVALINTAYIERLQATYPLSAGSVGASYPRRGTQTPYARSRDVADRCFLQSALGAPLSGRGTHSGNGGEAYGSSLVNGGVAELCCAAFGATEMAWAQAHVAGGDRGCSLPTVHCGATRKSAPSIFWFNNLTPAICVLHISA